MSSKRILSAALLAAGLLLQAGRPVSGWAQTASASDSLRALPTLEAVIEQSLAFAPQIERNKALLRKNEELADRTSKSWLQGISLGVQSTAGTYGNTNVDQLNVGATAAASIRFSFFDIFAQRDQKKMMRYELEASREEIRFAEVEETQYVVGLYHLVENLQRQVAIKADAWRGSQVHREMAELEFTNGNITVADLARVSEIEGRAYSEYLSVVSEYQSSYRQLEVRIGAQLSSLQ